MLSLILAGATLASATVPLFSSYNFPVTASNKSLDLTTVDGAQAFDGVYIPKPNSTSYEWWYFDALASDVSQSVVFQPLIDQTRPSPELLFSFSVPNGSYTEFTIPTEGLSISTTKDGSVGVASDGGFSWRGAPDMSEYFLTLDYPEYGISGDIHFQSVWHPCLIIPLGTPR